VGLAALDSIDRKPLVAIVHIGWCALISSHKLEKHIWSRKHFDRAITYFWTWSCTGSCFKANSISYWRCRNASFFHVMPTGGLYVFRLQQPVHSGLFISAGAADENAIVSVETKHDRSVKSMLEKELPVPADTMRGDTGRLDGATPQLELLAGRQSWRIAVKAKGKIFFLETADIFTVHALGDYASLKHRSSSYLVRESLSSLAMKLKPYGFIRTNRSVLVNTSFVDELWPVSRGEYRLRVRDGKEYTVTRGNKGNLRYLAHLWLGSERICSSSPEEK
jgi:LytTr DNA-binding domain-containing protein